MISTIIENHGLIAETESLAESLGFPPVVTVHPHSVTARVQASFLRMSEIRAAIANAGLEIESETRCDGTGYQRAGEIAIQLKGCDIPINCTCLIKELAEAA